jgi:hypothetical protein
MFSCCRSTSAVDTFSCCRSTSAVDPNSLFGSSPGAPELKKKKGGGTNDGTSTISEDEESAAAANDTLGIIRRGEKELPGERSSSSVRYDASSGQSTMLTINKLTGEVINKLTGERHVEGQPPQHYLPHAPLGNDESPPVSMVVTLMPPVEEEEPSVSMLDSLPPVEETSDHQQDSKEEETLKEEEPPQKEEETLEEENQQDLREEEESDQGESKQKEEEQPVEVEAESEQVEEIVDLVEARRSLRHVAPTTEPSPTLSSPDSSPFEIIESEEEDSPQKTPEKRRTSGYINITKSTLILPSKAAITYASSTYILTSRKPLVLTGGYLDCTNVAPEDERAYETWYQNGLLRWRPAQPSEHDVLMIAAERSPPSPQAVNKTARSLSSEEDPAVADDSLSPRSLNSEEDPAVANSLSPRSLNSEEDPVVADSLSPSSLNSEEDPVVADSLSPRERKRKAEEGHSSPQLKSPAAAPDSSASSQRTTRSPSSSPQSISSPSSQGSFPLAPSRKSFLDRGRRAPIASMFGTPVKALAVHTEQLSPSSETEVSPTSSVRVSRYQNYVSAYKSYVGNRASPNAKSTQDEAHQQLERSKQQQQQQQDDEGVEEIECTSPDTKSTQEEAHQ